MIPFEKIVGRKVSMIRNVIIAISAIGGLALQSPSALAEAVGEGGEPVSCKEVCVALPKF